MLNNLFATNNVLGLGLSALQLRDTVISNNIANIDTPGFRRDIVEFENALLDELNVAVRTGTAINLDNVHPTVHTTLHNNPLRLDGNNIDIEMEMVALYQNEARYNTIAISLMNNFRRINTVLNSNI
ncbi:MAG: flagellar basal body rod protein FlgB [Defluviitaleaceae bacterium]|nr:flagellar basal body rod protein FlgB [Defluviitaleaceae bacterium]